MSGKVQIAIGGKQPDENAIKVKQAAEKIVRVEGAKFEVNNYCKLHC